MTSSDPFSLTRADTFDQLIALAQRHAQAGAPAFILDMRAAAPTLAKQAAEREIWTLIASALQYLKDGGIDGQPGALAGAVSKASLRSSALAATLQIRPPQFEQIVFDVTGMGGRQDAMFHSRRLIEAAESDLPKSEKIIRCKIVEASPEVAFGDIAAFRKQTALAFNALVRSYAAACRDFRREMDSLPMPPKPGAKGRGFDF